MTFRIQKSWRWLVALGAVFVPGIVSGALTLPFTFSSGTPIKAADVNANFEALRSRIDALSNPGAGTTANIGTLTVPNVFAGVPIHKFSESITVPTTTAAGGGSAKPVLSDVEVVHDQSTVVALSNASDGKVLPTVTIAVGNLSIKLTNAVISAIKVAPALAGHPQEVLDFSFSTIEWSYNAGSTTLVATYDRGANTGGSPGPVTFKYGVAPAGVTLDSSFTPASGYTTEVACPSSSTTAAGAGGCKLNFGPIAIQKGLGQEVIAELAAITGGGSNKTVDLQWFSDATTLSSRVRLTNAGLNSWTLTSKDDGSLSDAVGFNYQKLQLDVGTTSTTVTPNSVR